MPESLSQACAYKVLVVDDEPAARRKLIHFLREHTDFVVVAEAKDGIEALECIEEFSPSLVFLDVQMPRLDGISVAGNLEFNNDITVVFVTGFNEYAIKAFELNAVDYLLKPYDKDRLAKTLDRFRASSAGAPSYDIPKLVQDCRADKNYPKTLLFKSEGSVQVAQADEIQWLESSGNYVKVCLDRTAFIARQTLSGVQSQLDPAVFVRVHRSHIVNIHEITQATPISKGDHVLLLKSGVELRLSRAYRDEFFEVLDKNNVNRGF